jgi:hypothetical protein
MQGHSGIHAAVVFIHKAERIVVGLQKASSLV